MIVSPSRAGPAAGAGAVSTAQAPPAGGPWRGHDRLDVRFGGIATCRRSFMRTALLARRMDTRSTGWARDRSASIGSTPWRAPWITSAMFRAAGGRHRARTLGDPAPNRAATHQQNRYVLLENHPQDCGHSSTLVSPTAGRRPISDGPASSQVLVRANGDLPRLEAASPTSRQP